MIPGELCSTGYLGRDDGDLAWQLCSSGRDEELKQLLQNEARQAHKHSKGSLGTEEADLTLMLSKQMTSSCSCEASDV